jgi:hypothetical protein
MDAPVCRTCGKKHWSRVCSGGDDVTPPSPKPVTPRVTVTETVTPRLVAPSRLAALEVENEALRAEIVMLKRKLAEAHGGGKAAMTGAERVRKLRERRKQSPA